MSNDEIIVVRETPPGVVKQVNEIIIERGAGQGLPGEAPTAQNMGDVIAAADAKPIPSDADLVGFSDSEDGDILKSLTFANLWTWIKGLADLDYQPLSTALSKITEAGGLPLWDGGAWPGGGSAENTVTGQTIDGGVGTVGLPYYLTSTDDTWLLSTKATEATISGQVGICSAANTIMFSGLVTLAAHGLGANGLPIYILAGVISATSPTTSGEFVRSIGTIEDANTIRVDISPTYSELG